MGVHDADKYDEVRSALGIPQGEPLFIIRAQDRLAVAAVAAYRRNYTQAAMIEQVPIPEIDRFKTEMDDVIRQFDSWQANNRVKFPD
jgi:hypothetical protein